MVNVFLVSRSRAFSFIEWIVIFIIFAVVILYNIILDIGVYSKYKNGRAFVKRCSKRTPAKVISTSIRRYELEEEKEARRHRCYQPPKVLIEHYNTYEYKIDDVIYKRQCIIPCGYVLTGNECISKGIGSYIYNKAEYPLDKEAKKMGDDVEICYNPNNPEEFYCVGDEDNMYEMSDKYDSCFKGLTLTILALIILITVAIYNW